MTKSKTLWDVLPPAYRELAAGSKEAHPMLLAYLRVHLQVVPSQEHAQSSSALRKFLKAEKTAAEAGPETRTVSVYIEENVWGRRRYSNTRILDGSVEVPVSVISSGSEAVDTWLRSNAYQQIDWSYGDEEEGDITEENSEETEFSSTSRDVCRAYQEGVRE